MFLIRADGNAEIGAGHMMRCMSIAEELLAKGQSVCFVCAEEQSAAFAKKYGFQSHVLETDYRNMESEIPVWGSLMEMMQETGDGRKHTILVDSYYVTDQYLKALRRLGYIGLLDDFGTQVYSVDYIINYNAHANRKEYENLYRDSRTLLLIGSDYVPLRRQFRTSRNHCCQVRDTVRDVLITTGGGDSMNIAGRILEKIYDREHVFHLVSGRFNPHFPELKAWEGDHANVHIHHDVTDMAQLMGECDIGLTAGGSTIYELAVLGIPFLCFSYADNQEALVRYVGRAGIAGAAGEWHHDSEKTLNEIGRLFGELCSDREKRAIYSSKGQEMVDGRGADRIAAELVRSA